MRSLKVFIFINATLLVCLSQASADFLLAGNCPPKNRVHNNKPTCFSDADCQKWGKICCPNQFNTKSCTDRAPWQNSARNNQKYSGCGAGRVNCGGVKCMPYEVSVFDPLTKKLRCQRA